MAVDLVGKAHGGTPCVGQVEIAPDEPEALRKTSARGGGEGEQRLEWLALTGLFGRVIDLFPENDDTAPVDLVDHIRERLLRVSARHSPPSIRVAQDDLAGGPF